MPEGRSDPVAGRSPTVLDYTAGEVPTSHRKAFAKVMARLTLQCALIGLAAGCVLYALIAVPRLGVAALTWPKARLFVGGVSGLVIGFGLMPLLGVVAGRFEAKLNEVWALARSTAQAQGESASGQRARSDLGTFTGASRKGMATLAAQAVLHGLLTGFVIGCFCYLVAGIPHHVIKSTAPNPRVLAILLVSGPAVMGTVAALAVLLALCYANVRLLWNKRRGGGT